MIYNNTFIFLTSVSTDGLKFGQFQLSVTLAVCLILGPAALWACPYGGGRSARDWKHVTPLEDQLRTALLSLPPLFHWPRQVIRLSSIPMGQGNRLHLPVTWQKTWIYNSIERGYTVGNNNPIYHC